MMHIDHGTHDRRPVLTHMFHHWSGCPRVQHGTAKLQQQFTESFKTRRFDWELVGRNRQATASRRPSFLGAQFFGLHEDAFAFAKAEV